MRRDVYPLVAALALSPAAARPQGNPLGPEFLVNTYTTNLQAYPAVAAHGSGFVVAWMSQQQGPLTTDIIGQRYGSSGAPLGPEFRINTFTPGYQGFPSIASDAAGNFVVVWQSYGQDGAEYGIFGQRYAGSGGPLGPEFRVNAYTTNDQRRPSVASDTSGNFVVVWQSLLQDGSGFGVFGQRYASSGAPLGAEFQVNSTTGAYQLLPAVATDSAGNFIVVWESSQYGSGFDIFGQRYAGSGAPLGVEFRVNTFATGAQFAPRVAPGSSGNFAVVWGSLAQDGSYSGIFGQRYAGSGAPLGPEFRVNTFTTNGQSYPAVASDPLGDFVVVWNSHLQDGSDWGVFGQRFATTGNPLGPEFRVNTYTTGLQLGPSVAADPSGSFVVTWFSSGQDGSSFGVFGQRYNPILPVELMDFGIE